MDKPLELIVLSNTTASDTLIDHLVREEPLMLGYRTIQKRVTYTIPSVPGTELQFAASINHYLVRKGYDETRIFHAVYALNEAILNGIHHAEWEIVRDQQEDYLLVRFRFPGDGFDVHKAQVNPIVEGEIWKQRHGRGHMYLARFSEYVAYTNHGRDLHLVFKLGKSATEEEVLPLDPARHGKEVEEEYLKAN